MQFIKKKDSFLFFLANTDKLLLIKTNCSLTNLITVRQVQAKSQIFSQKKGHLGAKLHAQHIFLTALVRKTHSQTALLSRYLEALSMFLTTLQQPENSNP